MKFYTFDTAKNKNVLVGNVEDKTLYKSVNPAKHYMRKYGGYGIQYEALKELRETGIEKIIIKKSTGGIIETKLIDWFDKGHLEDVGNGKQVFLTEE